MNIQSFILHFFTYGILIYSVGISSYSTFLSAFIPHREIKRYLRLNSFADFRVPAASEHLPGISIVAPAYNEAANIVENVRSMLSIHYNTLELIIVNDGSKDDSLQKLIDAYDLYKTNVFINEQIPTKKVKGVYKSNNPVFKKLIVVDKENGGKADALECGNQCCFPQLFRMRGCGLHIRTGCLAKNDKTIFRRNQSQGYCFRRCNKDCQ